MTENLTDPPEPPPEPDRAPPPESWSHLPVNQQPFPDRTDVERLENIISFVFGALIAAPAGFGLFVLCVHGDRVVGIDWATAAWILIAACGLGGGYLLARVKPTLR
jgi:hypothetical protein